MVPTGSLPSWALLALFLFIFFSFGLHFAELRWKGKGLPRSKIRGSRGRGANR